MDENNRHTDYLTVICDLLAAYRAATPRDLERAALRWQGKRLTDVASPAALRLEEALRVAERRTGWTP